jgi:hypothetical protein
MNWVSLPPQGKGMARRVARQHILDSSREKSPLEAGFVPKSGDRSENPDEWWPMSLSEKQRENTIRR